MPHSARQSDNKETFYYKTHGVNLRGLKDQAAFDKRQMLHLPISPCFVILAEWILRISMRACSLGSGISGKKK